MNTEEVLFVGASALVSGLFLFSGASKIRYPKSVAESVTRRYAALSGRRLRPLMWLLPRALGGLELAIGALTFPSQPFPAWGRQVGMTSACLLLAAYLLFGAVLVRTLPGANCGCFGGNRQLSERLKPLIVGLTAIVAIWTSFGSPLLTRAAIISASAACLASLVYYLHSSYLYTASSSAASRARATMRGTGTEAVASDLLKAQAKDMSRRSLLRLGVSGTIGAAITGLAWRDPTISAAAESTSGEQFQLIPLSPDDTRALLTTARIDSNFKGALGALERCCSSGFGLGDSRLKVVGALLPDINGVLHRSLSITTADRNEQVMWYPTLVAGTSGAVAVNLGEERGFVAMNGTVKPLSGPQIELLARYNSPDADVELLQQFYQLSQGGNDVPSKLW